MRYGTQTEWHSVNGVLCAWRQIYACCCLLNRTFGRRLPTSPLEVSQRTTAGGVCVLECIQFDSLADSFRIGAGPLCPTWACLRTSKRLRPQTAQSLVFISDQYAMFSAGIAYTVARLCEAHVWLNTKVSQTVHQAHRVAFLHQ